MPLAQSSFNLENHKQNTGVCNCWFTPWAILRDRTSNIPCPNDHPRVVPSDVPSIPSDRKGTHPIGHIQLHPAIQRLAQLFKFLILQKLHHLQRNAMEKTETPVLAMETRPFLSISMFCPFVDDVGQIYPNMYTYIYMCIYIYININICVCVC